MEFFGIQTKSIDKSVDQKLGVLQNELKARKHQSLFNNGKLRKTDDSLTVLPNGVVLWIRSYLGSALGRSAYLHASASSAAGSLDGSRARPNLWVFLHVNLRRATGTRTVGAHLSAASLTHPLSRKALLQPVCWEWKQNFGGAQVRFRRILCVLAFFIICGCCGSGMGGYPQRNFVAKEESTQ